MDATGNEPLRQSPRPPLLVGLFTEAEVTAAYALVVGDLGQAAGHARTLFERDPERGPAHYPLLVMLALASPDAAERVREFVERLPSPEQARYARERAQWEPVVRGRVRRPGGGG